MRRMSPCACGYDWKRQITHPNEGHCGACHATTHVGDDMQHILECPARCDYGHVARLISCPSCSEMMTGQLSPAAWFADFEDRTGHIRLQVRDLRPQA